MLRRLLNKQPSSSSEELTRQTSTPQQSAASPQTQQASAPCINPAAPQRGPWLDAHYDPLAGVKCFSCHLHTCNLFGDGDWHLVVAGLDKRLRVWRGTALVSEHALQDVPSAVVSFHTDARSPQIPALAVAGGPNVFIYRNMRPYYRFTVPLEAVQLEEQAVWDKHAGGELDDAAAVVALQAAQRAGLALTATARQLLSLSDAGGRAAAMQRRRGQAPVRQTYVVCMDVLRRSLDEEGAVGCLLLGTEDGRLLVLDQTCSQVTHTWSAGGTPAFIASSGSLEVESSVAVATRAGRLLLLTDGQATATVALPAHAVGLVRLGRGAVIGCTDSSLHSYNHRGKRSHSIVLPAPILSMQLLQLQRQRATKCVLVGLKNGELRIYNERHLISLTQLAAPASAMACGRYGREECALVSVLQTGALDIKMLSRTADLEARSQPASMPEGQDVPLDVPKKTRVYVEQTERERANAVEMHNAFQQGLMKLRLSTARAYLKVLGDGQGAAAFSQSAQVEMHASVAGLGPAFKLRLVLQNSGSKPIFNVPLVLMYNKQLYSSPHDQTRLPAVVPHRPYALELDVLCLNPLAPAEAVRVLALSTDSCIPMLSALVQMPLADIDELA